MKTVLALVVLVAFVAATEAGVLDSAQKAVNAAINTGIKATEKIISKAEPDSTIQKGAKAAQDALGWAAFDSDRIFHQAKQISDNLFNKKKE